MIAVRKSRYILDTKWPDGLRTRFRMPSEGKAKELDLRFQLAILDNTWDKLRTTLQMAPEKKVVDAARRAGVRRVVKLSALRAVEEEFVFGRWHRAVEKHIEASGLAWTFLRPNGFMQNVVTYMAGTIRSHAAIYSSAGNGAVSHVDVRDLAAVGAAVLAESGHEGQAYDLTGPAALTYTQVAEILSRVLARPIRYVPISPEQYKQGALAAGTPETYADALVDLNRYYAEGKMSEITPTLRLLSGRDPTPFEQFARDHAELLR